jgi:HSP20 family protein
MRIARYRPGQDMVQWPRLGTVPERFNRVFEELLGAMPVQEPGWAPAVDVIERDDEVIITAELPGMSRDDVQVEVAEGVLTIKGEKQEVKEEAKDRYRVVERMFGRFERTFSLPVGIDPTKTAARFENGVLTVHLPRVPRPDARHVKIQ